MSTLLDLRGVSKKFGGVQALNQAYLQVEKGTITGLIGPNGAGKTSFFNVMTGLYQADSGEFFLHDMQYNPSAVDQVLKAGIARTFQNIRLFKEMTVLENVMVGRHTRTNSGLISTVFKTRANIQEEEKIREDAYRLLCYVGIDQYQNQLSKNLSYGAQRRLEIARALATEPLLLALDEPAAGMNQTEKKELKVLLEKIRSDGTTILMIEHDVKLVMGLCDNITVMDYGQIIAVGKPEDIRKNPLVIEAYLGVSHHEA
jgi:branched-chain amino acid transport system ATP-binding protein